MGWGRTLLLGDIGNRMDIADTEQDIERLKRRLKMQTSKDDSQDEQLMELHRENDELKLYLASLIRILVGKGVLAEDELVKFVDLIDAAD